jgi:IS30 family transposase
MGSLTQERLDAVAAELNGRPRQTLDWNSPAERLAQLLSEIPAQG